ncbi:MAG: hypothetical protein ACI4MC_02110 [Candidatus Coproplasma sp.]
MTVKEIICQTLRLVGRDDAADALCGEAELSAEITRTENAFLTYFNSVLDELSRGYFPLPAEEEVTFSQGKTALSSFGRRVVRIKKLLVGKKPIKWHISQGYLCADAENAAVFYEYAPEPLKEEDEFFYPEFAVSERLVQYGMAAEHFLVSGCADESRMWEQRYRDEIEALIARCTVKPCVPPRRWI